MVQKQVAAFSWTSGLKPQLYSQRVYLRKRANWSPRWREYICCARGRAPPEPAATFSAYARHGRGCGRGLGCVIQAKPHLAHLQPLRACVCVCVWSRSCEGHAILMRRVLPGFPHRRASLRRPHLLQSANQTAAKAPGSQ